MHSTWKAEEKMKVPASMFKAYPISAKRGFTL